MSKHQLADTLMNSQRLQIISLLETTKRLNLARSTLYTRLDRKSPYFDPELPKPVRYGSSVGFIEHEIDDYILGLMQARGGVD